MRKSLDSDLDILHRDLLTLAAAVEGALHQAIGCLYGRDAARAAEVVAGDDRIDALENAIHEECLRLLALHQPLARDLRRVTVVMSITTDLERVGDLATSLAGRAAALARQPALAVPQRLAAMADLAAGMLRQSLEALVNLDGTLARAVCRRDEDVDRLNVEVIGELVRAMKEQPEAVEPALSLFSATRHLERAADHATNIAEGVIHLVEGAVVRHHPEAIRSESPAVATPTFPVGPAAFRDGIPS